ncbi:hypothetical protein ACMFMG_001806 [Clarireedia jacksonii]
MGYSETTTMGSCKTASAHVRAELFISIQCSRRQTISKLQEHLRLFPLGDSSGLRRLCAQSNSRNMPDQHVPYIVHSMPSQDLNDSGQKDSRTIETSRVERVFPIRIETTKDVHQTFKDLAAKAVRKFPNFAASLPLSSNHFKPPDSEDVAYVETEPPKLVYTEASELSLPSGSTTITSTVHRLSSNDQHEDFAAPEKLLRCEDEPIHLPEAVQAFGALVALKDTGKGNYPVRIASENSQDVINHGPEALFGLTCFTSLLNVEEKSNFLARIGTAKLWHHKKNSRAYPDVFKMMVGRSSSSSLNLYCALHYREDEGLFVCEFEPKNDLSTDIPPDNSSLPEESINIIDNQASTAERSKSITKYSEPLRTAQRMKHEIGELEVFHLLCEIQEQINSADSIPLLLDILVGLVFDLTGFHRVMVYQFDDDDAGVVRSEFIDERASIDLYRGLHFPASDIPAQARKLYKLNKTRLLYDREQPTARLVYRTKEDALTPLDQSMSYLRAMSPVHKQYLKNMGVRASFSISLIVHDRLWGLISCHDYGLEGRRVSFPVRELCRSLGDCASNNIEKLLYLSRIQARKLLAKVPPKVSPASYVAASSSDLLEMFEADFGFLAIRDEARTIGRLFAYNECLALLQYIRSKSHKVVFSTQSIAADCPDILFPARFTSISGMLVIPLALSGSDFLVFFRKGQLKEVNWAGNPHKKKFKPGTSYLEPRASFRRWIESAGILSALYGRFIEVWRQKEAIVQQNRMTRLLIRQAGADVRTPLNAIINYLEIALDGSLDEQARLHLEKSLIASRSLIFVVNDLLSLTEVEEDAFEFSHDTVLLDDMMTEVIEAFHDECHKKNLTIKFDENTDTPSMIKCDGVRLRQTISSLLSNTVKHSSGGDVTVGLKNAPNESTQATTEARTPIEIYFENHGSGLTELELDGLFMDLEKIIDDDDAAVAATTEATEGQTHSIGLGLASAARFVRLNDGKMTISSKPGNGTRVAIFIPFRKAGEVNNTTDQKTPPIINRDYDASDKTPTDRTGNWPTPEGLFSTSPSQSKDRNPISPTVESPSSAKSTTTNKNYQIQYPFPIMELPPQPKEPSLKILYAEDNLLNSRFLEERLRRKDYEVHIVANGQICADNVRATPDEYDIILMDIQMPIANGLEATRMIRASEKASSTPVPVSKRAISYGRLPIIAVSASLVESKRLEYMECGFDGWLMKPIDFKRLEDILTAVEDEKVREGLLYGNVQWDKGGWFRSKGV